MTQRGIAQVAAAGALTLGVLTMAGLPVASRHVEENQYVAIRWLDVAGQFERVSAEQIRAAAAPHLTDGFFALQLDELKGGLESLPWIRDVVVRKRWPDQVHLTVYEHQPLARWGEHQLVSHRGDVFSVESPNDIEGLARLAGPDGTSRQVVEFYDRLRNELIATGLDIQALTLTPRGAWEAGLTGGIVVTMGTEQPLARFERFVLALDELGVVPGHIPERVDLRYPNGFAVSWPEPKPVGVVDGEG